MLKKQIHYIEEIGFITFIWILITLFYAFIKFNDIPEPLLLERYGLNSGVSKKWLYQISLLISFPLGILLGLLHTFVYPRFYRTKNSWIFIFFRTFLFSVICILILVALSFHPKLEMLSLSKIFTADSLINILIYMFLTENVIGVFLLLRRNLGRSYFINTIVNTYQNPKEEERVFMFLDLENSTPTATRMGHLNFSRYMQDCFYDLSDIVLEYGGEVYQFVGDEAVITWKISKKFNYEKCIRFYFSYKEYLEKKQDYYLKKHNSFPVFRCAVHNGKVSTALVGDYKKEIAYHGDVLNFCSRLQKSCKENNAYILVSEEFYKNISTSFFQISSIVIENLKGIEKNQLVYKISYN